MNRNFTALIISAIAFAAPAHAQNLILNPGFEAGSIPTGENQVAYATSWSRNCGMNRVQSPVPHDAPGSPDLFDRRTSNCLYSIPSNKWDDLETRAGGNRYVGFVGYATYDNPYFGETVEGTLTAPLVAGAYDVTLWAAAGLGVRQQCNQIIPATDSDPRLRIEVVLRKGNDCSTGKSVFVSFPVTSGYWKQYHGQFTLSPADAVTNYDRIEFRIAQVTAPMQGRHQVFLDDVALVRKAAEGTRSCTCPPDALANTTNEPGGITTDERCKKHVCGPISAAPLPPDGTAIGTWGFTWGDGIWQWIAPNCFPATGKAYKATFLSSGGYYMSAQGGGGAEVTCDRLKAASWEFFDLVDLNGGALMAGDMVNLRASAGMYVVAENGGGGAVNANRAVASTWETFTILKAGGQAGTIGPGDPVAFRSSSGRYLSADGGGGKGLTCTGTSAGAWETFTYLVP